MDYEAYQKTLIFSATPLMKPLDAPVMPPPITLEPNAEPSDVPEAESELVTQLLKEYILKQNVTCIQKEIKRLQSELTTVREEYDVLLEKYNDAEADSHHSPPSQTLLSEAIRSRSSSAM